MPLRPEGRTSGGVTRVLGGALLLLLLVGPAVAQARNPFSVGISEGGGSATGVTGWLLAQQAWLEHELALGVRAAKLGSAGAWPLVMLSLVYGVFHAAGPGHGKAVLASYMVANERAWRRGVLLSFAAALFQGAVAVVLIGLLTFLLHVTAASVKATASWIETASFATVTALGLSLVWRKGRGLARVWRETQGERSWPGAASIFAAPTSARVVAPGLGAMAIPLMQEAPVSRFACEPAHVAHQPDCLHCLGPDPRTLLDPRFDLKQAIWTVVAAGLRPCSGAILVLVFAVAQGDFAIGIASVAAMSLGVAVTTSVLASCAVLCKSTVSRIVGHRSRRAALAGAVLEFGAAGVVLAAGVLLLSGYAVSAMS